uniref:Prion/Doppel protein beta-ribbon domain-containing protein n=1 Tax=Xenopus tropicalis TaxID=8364 RepID=A0A6I8RG81_XENTR
MGRQNLFSCLILLLLILYCSLSSPRRAASSKKISKTTDLSRGAKRRPKVTNSPALGDLSFRGRALNVNFNLTEESELYTANLYSFPDGLYYPRPAHLSGAGGTDEFISGCLNTTIERNKVWISQLEDDEEGDIYMSVATQVLQFLCMENYVKPTNGAVTLSVTLHILSVIWSAVQKLSLVVPSRK